MCLSQRTDIYAQTVDGEVQPGEAGGVGDALLAVDGHFVGDLEVGESFSGAAMEEEPRMDADKHGSDFGTDAFFLSVFIGVYPWF